MAKVFAPGANFNPTAVDYVPITLSGADLDLTSSSGPTGGFCCRAVKIGGTGGNLVVDTLRSTQVTVPVAANEVVQLCCSKIYSSASGTTATPVGVFL
jgi:hypothetical protein